MPYVHTTDTLTHHNHGAHFTSLATPTLGSTDLCVWQVTFPDHTPGIAHTLTHEEIFVVTTGSLRFTIDGHTATLTPGEAALVPAGQSLQIDNTTTEPASALVSTRVGIQGTLADGTTITPPWSR
jgi:mannose-6-phosphate isomerase-like protein (cupin superfamily)